MRPKAPYLHAVSIVNYPSTINAYPWEGFAILSQPATDYQTPGTVPAAEETNWLFNQVTGFQASVLDLVGQADAQNWPSLSAAPPSVSTTNQLWHADWDPANGRWVLHIDNSSTPGALIFTSVDGCKTFTRLDTGGGAGFSTSIPGMAVRSTDGRVAIVADGLGAWVNPSTGVMTSSSTPVNTASHTEVRWFAAAGLFVATGDGNDGTHKYVITSPDGATWTDRTATAAIPTAFGPGTGLNVRPVLGYNSTTLLICSAKAGYGTFYSSTDGVNYTARTSPVGASEAIQSVSYDTQNSLWVLLVNDGTNSKVYTSTNLTSWTSHTISTNSSTVFTDLACNGALWVAVVKCGTGTGSSRAAYSVDAGVTWRWSLGYSMTWPASTLKKERLVTNGNQLLASNGAVYCASLNVGETSSTVT